MTKEEKTAEFLKTPLTVGESIYVHRSKLEKYQTNNNKKDLCEIVSIDGDVVKVTCNRINYTINKNDILERFGSFYVGSNGGNKKRKGLETDFLSTDTTLANNYHA